MEREGKLTRRLCTHNRYFEDFDDLCDTVFDNEEWRGANETLKNYAQLFKTLCIVQVMQSGKKPTEQAFNPKALKN